MIDTRCLFDCTNQFEDICANGWLATSQAKLGESKIPKQANHQQYLLILHQLSIWPKHHVIGHAIYATQVAVISQADA
jgi:hypothetical protein